jgi:hypothetical protein
MGRATAVSLIKPPAVNGSLNLEPCPYSMALLPVRDATPTLELPAKGPRGAVINLPSSGHIVFIKAC